MSEPRWSRALITGASSGIGDSFCGLLAERGTHLVLVARSEDVLENLAAQLRINDIDVEVLPADLTDEASLAKVEARLGDSSDPIDLLVNNAGFGTAGDFCELDIERETRQINLNVVAVVRLAHAAACSMHRHGGGGIINVSSIAGSMPGPKVAVYAGTKAFITSFGESLWMEEKDKGVSVTTVLPGPTRTKWSEVAEVDTSSAPEFIWSDPDDVATTALDAVAHGRPLATHKATNRAMVQVMRFAPRKVARGIVQRMSDQST